jgi:aminobenzoyl-glutamate utilization protein B
VDAIGDPDLVARAKADLASRTARTPYESPMPPEVGPPLGMSKGGG